MTTTTHRPRGWRRLVTAVLVLIVGTLGLAPASQAAGGGSVSGTIAIPSSTASIYRQNIRVVLSNANNGRVAETTSDDAGRYVIPSVAAGSYRLYAFPERSSNMGVFGPLAVTVNGAESVNFAMTVGSRATFTITDNPAFPNKGKVTYLVRVLDIYGFTVTSRILTATTPREITGLGTAKYTLQIWGGSGAWIGPRLYLGNTYQAVKAQYFTISTQGGSTFAGAFDTRTRVFTDVPSSAVHATYMARMLDQGLSTGWPDGSYRPGQSVTREAMAAFLYRLAGKPSFTPPTASPFVDVSTSTTFYKEITWLYAEGISTGWTVNGKQYFRQLQPVARDAMAAFLFRFASAQVPSIANFPAPTAAPFVDVSTTRQFAREIAWMKKSEISTGWSDGTYRPSLPVARDAMGAFIIRFSSYLTWASQT